MAMRFISLTRVQIFFAVIVLLLTLGFIVAVPRTIQRGPAVLVGPLALMWEALTVVAPGILAVTVLFDVLMHGYRLVGPHLDTSTPRRPGDRVLSHVLVSGGLGILAAYTLWWVIGSVYVMYVVRVGGIPPAIVALMLGGILAVFVLGKVVFFELFPRGPMARIRRLRARRN